MKGLAFMIAAAAIMAIVGIVALSKADPGADLRIAKTSDLPPANPGHFTKMQDRILPEGE